MIGPWTRQFQEAVATTDLCLTAEMSETQRLSLGERLARWPDWRVRLLVWGGLLVLTAGTAFEQWLVVAIAAIYFAALGVLLFRRR